MLDRFPIETSIEVGAASDANDADPNEAAVAPASIDTGFDATSVTATVNPLQAPAPATVETGFADLDGTPAPVQQAAPAVNTMADTGGRQNPDADLDARVAALLPNKSITNWNAVSAFMGAVVPWPGLPQDPGWIAVPNGYVAKQLPGGRDPKTGKYPIGPGKAFKTVDTLISYAGWANTTDFIKDLFFCLSMQREVTIKKNSKGADIIQAKRTAAGAIAVKAIWLDVDVGKENAYADLKEALGAAIMFREAVGLPPFSAIVGSGGGIHLYWISDRALTPDEWSPYAEGLKALAAQHGLKCDLGVTTDIARVLRVPGSFNHKEGTPRPCQLFNVPLKQYDFNTALGFLRQITPIGQVKAPAAATHSIYADGKNAATFGVPHPLFAGLTGQLQDGIGKHENVLLDPRPIFTKCGFYRGALRNGGADYDNALWMYSILGATFMENGNDIAHKISSGHSTYSPADTQAMFDRKVAERADGRVGGYPQCATIAGAGCQACKTCPLLGKVRSPLNIRPVVTATVTNSSSPSGSSGQANWIGRSGISFSNIPHRPWLYGVDLVRGELTVIGSPGGIGKSSLAIGMAICVATNRELLGENILGEAISRHWLLTVRTTPTKYVAASMRSPWRTALPRMTSTA
jgi:hypothetical protein